MKYLSLILFLCAIALWVLIPPDNGMYGTNESYIPPEDTTSPYYEYQIPNIKTKDTGDYKLGPHEVEINH